MSEEIIMNDVLGTPEGQFQFEVTNIEAARGVGSRLVGSLISGTVCVGDKVYIQGVKKDVSNNVKVEVKAISVDGKAADSAQVGQSEDITVTIGVLKKKDITALGGDLILFSEDDDCGSIEDAFEMDVQAAYPDPNRNTLVLCGTIYAGTVKVGDPVIVGGTEGTVETIVTGVVQRGSYKIVESGVVGMNDVMLLTRLSMSEEEFWDTVGEDAYINKVGEEVEETDE